MTSQESKFENMLNDEDAWDEPKKSTKKKSERRQRGAMVSVRLTGEEMASLQNAAKQRGLSIAAFVRERAIGSVEMTVSPVKQFALQNATGLDPVWAEDVTMPQYVRPARAAS